MMCVRSIFLALAIIFTCAEAAMAQTGRWLRAESANFIVYSNRSERALREATERLEDFDATLRIMTRMAAAPAQSKLEVYLVPEDSLRLVRPGISGEVRGFYTSSPEAMAVLLIYNDIGGFDRAQLLYHEYAHHFMLHYFPGAYPNWYIEGWAEYVSTVEFRDRSAIVGAPSLRGAEVLAWGVARMVHMLAPEDGARRDPELWARFYATGWLATASPRRTNRPDAARSCSRR